MSAARTDYADPLAGIRTETISAQSALNMEPRPIPGATGYLSDVDEWAAHAYEHVVAAFDLAVRAELERAQLKSEIRRLEVALAAARKVQP